MKRKREVLLWCLLLTLAAVVIGHGAGVFRMPDWSVRVLGLMMMALLFFNVFYTVKGRKDVEK